MSPATVFQVLAFLIDFKQACGLDSGKLIVAERKKNREALIRLGITKQRRLDAIMSLKNTDYYRGPGSDPLKPTADVYEFGIDVDGFEVYVKLSLIDDGGFMYPMCLSFHEPEETITYPLRKY